MLVVPKGVPQCVEKVEELTWYFIRPQIQGVHARQGGDGGRVPVLEEPRHCLYHARDEVNIFFPICTAKTLPADLIRHDPLRL